MLYLSTGNFIGMLTPQDAKDVELLIGDANRLKKSLFLPSSQLAV